MNCRNNDTTCFSGFFINYQLIATATVRDWQGINLLLLLLYLYIIQYNNNYIIIYEETQDSEAMKSCPRLCSQQRGEAVHCWMPYLSTRLYHANLRILKGLFSLSFRKAETVSSLELLYIRCIDPDRHKITWHIYSFLPVFLFFWSFFLCNEFKLTYHLIQLSINQF